MDVRFERVVKKYGTTFAVKDLDLHIQDGSLHFLLGPSGCGKTTTLRMLAGLEDVTSGRIFMGNVDVTHKAASDRGIGMVFQNYALWPHMTVLKNIEYGLKLRKLTPKEIQQRVDDVLEITQLKSYAKRFPGQLSGGQQQRVALARALAIRPNVLLLDEPLSNLDAKLRLEMRDNIIKIHRQTKITTLYVTHDQKEALSMGTEVSVMRAGLLVQTDTPRNLYDKPNTAFIAGFIGETNFIHGVYLGREAKGLHRVKTSLGELLVGRSVRDFKLNDKVLLSIRPEQIRLAPNSEQGDAINSLSLQLESITFLGEHEQVLLVGGGVSLRATMQHRAAVNFEVGQKLYALVHAQDALLVPDDQDLSSMT